MCSILVASKNALKSGQIIEHTPIDYVNTTEFSFLPEGKWLRKKQYKATDVSQWLEKIKSRELKALQLFCPVEGFFKEGPVTYFVPDWQFDPQLNKWNVHYTEYVFHSPSYIIPTYENNRDSFREILSEIGDLAHKLNCDEFAELFNSARRLLDGQEDVQGEKLDKEFLEIPKEQLQLFEAANLADVFGGMGSWNDHPRAQAEEMGLLDQYEKLSDELLRNVRLALLYAINEW